MYASITALVLLGLSLAWTALNKSGIVASDWYIALILIGLAWIAFWSRPRRIVCPALPKGLIWTIRGILYYLIFQAIPLPLPLLAMLSPARGELTRALVPALGPIAAAPISVDPAAHILWLLTLTGCGAVFFLVRDLTFRLQNKIFFALLPLLLVATFEALLGLVQIASGAEQAVGSYNSRDHYCCILEMTLPLSIAFGFYFFQGRSITPSIWPVVKAIACWLTSAVIMLGILFSLSRAGWIDSLVSLLALAMLILFPRTSSTSGRATILTGFLVLVLAAFLIASPDAMLGRLIGTITTDSNGRLYIWRQLLPLLHEFRWFGTGLMGFDPVFLQYQNFVNQARIDFAHNDFLQYLIEMGIIGFVPTLVGLAVIVWPIGKNAWFAAGKPEIRTLLAGCVASFTALFLHSLVDFNLYIPANVFAFAWILGLGSALTQLRYTLEEETPYAHPHTKHD